MKTPTPKKAKRIEPRTIDVAATVTPAVEIIAEPSPAIQLPAEYAALPAPRHLGTLAPYESSATLNRIVFDIPDHEYRQAPGVSNSQLKSMAPTPMHFRHSILTPQRDRHALNVGAVFHKAIFEPDLFGLDKSHVMRPDEFKDYRTSAAKEWRDAQTLPILTAVEHKANAGMAAAIRANRQAAAWLEGVRAEVALFAHDEDTGLMRKCKTDGLVSMEPVMLDVKTTEDASDFEKTAANFRYGQQEAYYRDIAAGNEVEIARFVFIVVEKEEPFGVRLCELGEEDVTLCRAVYRNDLRRLATCIARDEWPGYKTEPETITLPGWSRTQMELAALRINANEVPVDGKMLRG